VDPNETSSTPSPSRGRVLIVDDDADVLKAYRSSLTRAGYEVEALESPLEALERIRSGSFDTVVCDISMPEVDGIELLSRIRSHDGDLPVILATGAPALESAIDAVEYGAMRYLTKPVSTQKLRETVQRAVSLRKLGKLRQKLAALNDEGHGVSDLTALEAIFERAIDQLYLDFQPIVSWSRREIIGYEALVRSTEPAMRNPGTLLNAAERLDRLNDIGRSIRVLCAAAADRAPPDALLFVNLHTRDLLDDALYEDDAPLTQFAGRVVLEVTERARLEEVNDVGGRISRLREQGFRIAIDDIGAGYSGLTSFAQLEPEVVKLDMALVRDIDRRPTSRKLVGSLIALCTELDMKVVAEGIETAAERDTLHALGCTWMQGYLLGRPAAPFCDATF
jgi:EAL domain-containing protein (putative c-di-GMP-specific phosphodiesterase class I)